MKYRFLKITSICFTILIFGLLSVSVTQAVANNVVSTNYQYQAWGQYQLVSLYGKNYVPLSSNNVDKVAELVKDSRDTYTLKTGDRLDLGQGYSLLNRQVDVNGAKVWLELDCNGQYVDDSVIQVLYINGVLTTDSGNWTSTYNQLHVPVLKVHANKVYQNAVDSFVDIDGLWLIDYANAMTLENVQQTPTSTATPTQTSISQTPIASFTSNVASGNVPLSVDFDDTSTGTPTSWSWDFGDGATSTAQNPTHTYSIAGNYAVTLKATNNAGSNTVTNEITMTNPPPTPTPTPTPKVPVARFTSSVTSGTAPLTVAYSDTSTGEPKSWSWIFGDGATSTQQNPTHTYTDEGNYQVTLTVSNDAGSNMASKDLAVTDAQPHVTPTETPQPATTEQITPPAVTPTVPKKETLLLENPIFYLIISILAIIIGYIICESVIKPYIDSKKKQ
jgi:PKD repeat protein